MLCSAHFVITDFEQRLDLNLQDKRGIKMEFTGKSMVEIEIVESIKNESQQLMGSCQCSKVKRTDQINIIPTVNVIDQICLVMIALMEIVH